MAGGKKKTARFAVQWDAAAAAEVVKQLAAFPGRLRKKPVRLALGKIGRMMAKRAKQLAPRSKGDTRRRRRDAAKKALYQTIASKVKTYGPYVVMVVGPSYPAGAHGHLLEFGHKIVARGRKNAARGKVAGDELKKRARIGFVRAFPYMRPALADTRDAALPILAKQISEFISQQGAGGG